MSKSITEEVVDKLNSGFTVEQIHQITRWNKEWIQSVKDKLEASKQGG